MACPLIFSPLSSRCFVLSSPRPAPSISASRSSSSSPLHKIRPAAPGRCPLLPTLALPRASRAHPPSRALPARSTPLAIAQAPISLPVPSKRLDWIFPEFLFGEPPDLLRRGFDLLLSVGVLGVSKHLLRLCVPNDPLPVLCCQFQVSDSAARPHADTFLILRLPSLTLRSPLLDLAPNRSCLLNLEFVGRKTSMCFFYTPLVSYPRTLQTPTMSVLYLKYILARGLNNMLVNPQLRGLWFGARFFFKDKKG